MPPGGVDLGEWNATLTARMNRFREALRRGEASPRVGGHRRAVPLEYFGAKEVQRRGALHVHDLLRRSDGKALHLRTAELRRLAIAHGFGHEVMVRKVGLSKHGGSKAKSSRGAAFYVSKYGSKAADERERVRWASGAPGKRWRTLTASRGWGSTMKEQREAARLRSVAAGAGTPGRPDAGAAGRSDGPPHGSPAQQGAALDSLCLSYAEDRAHSPPRTNWEWDLILFADD